MKKAPEDEVECADYRNTASVLFLKTIGKIMIFANKTCSSWVHSWSSRPVLLEFVKKAQFLSILSCALALSSPLQMFHFSVNHCKNINKRWYRNEANV